MKPEVFGSFEAVPFFSPLVQPNNLVIMFTSGYFISCLAPNVTFATGMGQACILPFLLFGGFFTNPELVPSWLSWIKHISWFKYMNEILFVNQWEGYDIECPPELEAVGGCIYDTGEDVLQPYSFDVVWKILVKFEDIFTSNTFPHRTRCSSIS